MNTYLKIFTTLILFCIGGHLSAQLSNDGPIKVQAKGIFTSNNTIMVRWAPTNYPTWLIGRDSGFVVQRLTISNASGPVPAEQMNSTLVTTILLPKTQQQWQAAMQTDPVVGVAAGACFGENLVVTPPGTNSGIVSAQNLNTEKENRYGMSLFAADNSYNAAKMQNLLLEDNAVSAGFTYMYIIKPKASGANLFVKDEKIQVTASNPYTPPVIAEFVAEPGDSVALLSWNQSVTAEHYTSYNVWRSKNNGAFTKVNAQPITATEQPNGDSPDKIMYTARLENNTDTYKFNITGHTPFGFDGPNSLGIEVKGVAAPLKANLTSLKVSEGSTGMVIDWGFPEALNNKIQGFNVLRSSTLDGVYSTINPVIVSNLRRKHLDAAPLPSAYYRVEFVDLNNNKIVSVPMLAQKADSIPPLPPVSVSGKAVGTDGTLLLSWPASKSPDAMGYRVFTADQADGVYGQVNSTWIKDTFYYYQVNAQSLTEEKYFKVKAIDYRENASTYSPLCRVATADIVAPSMPVMRKAEPRSTFIYVEFVPSNSPDVVAHRILRKKKDEAEWKEIYKIEVLPNKQLVSYLDTSALVQYDYDYMAQAEDDSKLLSNSKVFPAKNTSGSARPVVTDFKARFLKSDELIELEWEYPMVFGVSSFIIYRGLSQTQLFEVGAVTPQQTLVGGAYGGPNPFANNGNGITNDPYSPTPGTNLNANLDGQQFNVTQGGAPTTTNKAQFEYKDTGFLPYKKYFYAIMVKYEDGSQSPMSVVKNTATY